MKLSYLKQKMKSRYTAADRGQLDDFEDSLCFFLSTFCFLLDILRQKICRMNNCEKSTDLSKMALAVRRFFELKKEPTYYEHIERRIATSRIAR
jgi:hypothetical protein